MRYAWILGLWIVLLGAAAPASVNKSLRVRIRDAANRVALDPKLVEAIVSIESAGKALAVSPKGAAGLMQVMEITARECSIHNRFHALDNLIGACECFRKLLNRYRGDIRLALAAYNAGPAHVDRSKGIPTFPETVAYVDRVIKLYAKLRKP